MKNLSILLLAVLLAATVSSCGYNYSNVINTNNNSTEVQLAANNFKVSNAYPEVPMLPTSSVLAA